MNDSTGTRGFARCPKCNELIDSSSTTCRFCNSQLNASELQAAAALHRKLTQDKAKLNNRRAMIASIGSLILIIALWALWFFRRTFRGPRLKF